MVSSNHYKWYLAPLLMTLTVICQVQAGIVIQFVPLIATALLALQLWVSRLQRAARQSYGDVVASTHNADLREQLCVRRCSWLIIFRGVIGHRIVRVLIGSKKSGPNLHKPVFKPDSGLTQFYHLKSLKLNFYLSICESDPDVKCYSVSIWHWYVIIADNYVKGVSHLRSSVSSSLVNWQVWR